MSLISDASNKINDPTLIVITGPTAVGKTKLAIDLAMKMKTEIISADSRQFYKDLQIGAAIPSPEELSKVPHHFIGEFPLTKEYNVFDYEHEVLKLLDALFQNKQSVILVGGSGLYINAVCYGMDQLPDADHQIRKELKDILRDKGIESLQKTLKSMDPDYYSIVDLNNPNRLIRAIEVCRATGKKFSDLRSNKPQKRPFRIVIIGLNLPREELFRRINERVDRMMAAGLLEEARSLRKYSHLNALNTVGYKELFQYFDDKITLGEAIEKIKVNTRKYAKRQITWFKKDNNIHWFSPYDRAGIMKYLKVKEVNGM